LSISERIIIITTKPTRRSTIPSISCKAQAEQVLSASRSLQNLQDLCSLPVLCSNNFVTLSGFLSPFEKDEKGNDQKYEKPDGSADDYAD
jgi:hypothetical protein